MILFGLLTASILRGNLLKVDGNPLKSQGLIAHPGQIPAVSVSYDGNYVFTCGGSDHCVNQWEINTAAVEEAAKLGGDGVEPYVQQLDGGEHGEFFTDMKDYFYYSQIRSQVLLRFQTFFSCFNFNVSKIKCSTIIIFRSEMK